MKKITLSGGIGDEVTVEAFKAELPTDGEDVEITLSSIGGYISDGFMFHDLINSYKGAVYMILSGFVASIAAYMTTAVKRENIKAYDDTVFMIHKAMGVSVGDHAAMESEADILKRLDQIIAGGYAKQTGKEKEEMLALMGAGVENKGTWFFGSEIIDAGFAGSIIESGKQLNRGGAVAAAFNCYRDQELNPKKRAIDMRAVAKLVEATNTVPAPEPKQKPNRKNEMTKEELIAEAKKLGITPEEFANSMGSNVFTEYEKVKTALGDDPVKTADEIKKRERNILLTEHFGPETDADGKVNELRDYANRALTDLSNESIEEFKKSPAAIRLAGEKADEGSETNKLGKKDEQTQATEGGMGVSKY